MYPKSVLLGSAVTTEEVAHEPRVAAAVRGLSDVDIEWEE